MTAEIHRSKYGTYHPNPSHDVAWTINDTRGYLDAGPICDECGRCNEVDCILSHHNYRCPGLSFAFICLDGGEALCSDCAEREGITIMECDCEDTK